MSTISQIFPPAPTFTETSLTDLSTKVYVITGGTSGTGLALAKILYGLNATIYLGARSQSRYDTAISDIKSHCPHSKGTLQPFIADLSSLQTIKPAVTAFLAQSYRLDVLFLNAGVMTPPPNSKTADGYDLELGTNCLASFLLVQLLLPIMETTASHFCHPNPSIRIAWVSSLLNISTPSGGVQFDAATGAPKQLKAMENYMQSKAGVYLLAQEFALRQSQSKSQSEASESSAANEMKHGNPHGVLHVLLNPGFMKTELQRHAPPPMRAVMSTVFKGPKYGAYTELYAGLAPNVKSGDFVIPWGRKGDVPCHLKESTKAGKEGEKSVSAKFYEWCEEQVRPFI